MYCKCRLVQSLWIQLRKLKQNNPEDSIILRKLSEAYNNVYFISNIVLLKPHFDYNVIKAQ